MNKRQIIKRLKRHIEVLKSDNSLMRRVIEDSPTMQELYDLYNQPLKVIQSPLHHYRIHKAMVYPDYWNKEKVMQRAAETIAHEMIPLIKENISHEDGGKALEFYGGKEYGLIFDFWVDESEDKE